MVIYTHSSNIRKRYFWFQNYPWLMLVYIVITRSFKQLVYSDAKLQDQLACAWLQNDFSNSKVLVKSPAF